MLASRQARSFFWAATAVTIAIAGLPFLAVASQFFVEADAIDQCLAVWRSKAAWVRLGFSVAIATLTSVFATVLGVTMGTLLERFDIIARRWALLLHALPLFIPPFLVALGAFFAFGTHGAFGSSTSAALLFHPVGVVGVLTVSFAPVVTLLTVVGLREIPRDLIDSAWTVASPLRCVRSIAIPLCRQHIALAATLVFALALSETTVAVFLRVDTYSAVVFARLGGIRFAPGEAAALVLPILGVGVGLLLAVRRWGRNEVFAGGARDPSSTVFEVGRGRATLSAAVWFVIAAQLTPVAMLAWRAGGSGVVQAVSTLGSSLWTSLFTSACAATLVIALGIVLGHAREHPWSWLGDTAGVFAFVVPSTVLAIGLVLAWNRPGTQFVYQTVAILIVGWSARYAVLGSRILARVMATTPCTFEQAAAVAGASYWMRMRRIVVPMHRRALTATWLVVFIFCFRDLDTAIVFYPPGMETLPIRIFTLEANGPQAVVAGLALIQTAVTGAVIVGIAVLLRGKRT